MSYRFEATLSELTYRGDRDERLTEFTVSGQGETAQEAMGNGIVKMGALGYDPRFLTDIGLLSAEEIAKAFHDAYERLAPQHGYETRPETARSWDDVPEENRSLMLATVTDVFEFFGIPLRKDKP